MADGVTKCKEKRGLSSEGGQAGGRVKNKAAGVFFLGRVPPLQGLRFGSGNQSYLRLSDQLDVFPPTGSPHGNDHAWGTITHQEKVALPLPLIQTRRLTPSSIFSEGDRGATAMPKNPQFRSDPVPTEKIATVSHFFFPKFPLGIFYKG